MSWETVGEIRCAPEQAWVYESGWQSWTPSGRYRGDADPPRAVDDLRQLMNYRPECPAPADEFQGEGLLAIEGPDRRTTIWAAPEPTRAVPSIRAARRSDRLVVTADGRVTETTYDARLPDALASCADELAGRLGLGPVPSLPALWCSWYCYWAQVSEDDMLGSLAGLDRLGLDAGIVQLDDGYQAEIGDWLDLNDRFTSLADFATRVHDTGRRFGIWTAPYFVGEKSRLAREHPEWLLGGVVGAEHWGQTIRVLDVTHPEAAEHLVDVFRTLRAWGVDYFKIDFVYGGALPGPRYGDADPIAAYRHGLELIRAGAGPDAVILGCGAPLLPSLGLVDAMRISPDVGPEWLPPTGDLSMPSGKAAVLDGRSRSWMHARFWVNDVDCLLARPQVPFRDLLADHVESSAGLAVSSDRLADLDEHGLELTRRVLRPSRTEPVRWDPDAGDDQGRIVP